MIKVGITGELGAGKSFISKIFEVLGISVYNSDDRSKKLISTNHELISKIKDVFGENIYEGNLYKNLADVVFVDDDKLSLLTSLISPYLIEDINNFYKENSDEKFCLIESAILFESELINLVDRVIYVYVPEDIRIERAKLRSNLSEEEYKNRMKNQMDSVEKIKKSDYIISNYDDFNINEMVYQIFDHLYNRDPEKYTSKKYLTNY